VRSKVVLIFFRNPDEKTQRPIHGIRVWKRAGHVWIKLDHITETLTRGTKLSNSKL
jgi:hypothetical protein